RFIDADKVAEDYLKGVKAIDSTSAKKDTIKTVAKVNKDTTKIANLSSFDSGKQSTAKVDSNTIKGNANPIRKYLQFPELQDKSGKPT
ncbi:hypothetical protein ABTE20_20610, partial [Acinetobacter baumannii]